MAQNTSAVNRLDNAYTSPSTALNQNESLNVYAKAPMAPAPNTATAAPPSGWSWPVSRLAKCVMLQKRNKIVNELLSTDNPLAAIAADSGFIGIIRKRANNMKNGAPGGWPTSSLYAEAMNSPQSQKLAVGSTVKKYTSVAKAHTAQPVTLFKRSKRMQFQVFVDARTAVFAFREGRVRLAKPRLSARPRPAAPSSRLPSPQRAQFPATPAATSTTRLGRCLGGSSRFGRGHFEAPPRWSPLSNL